MGYKVGGKIEGLEPLVQRLENLKQAVAKKILRRAVNDGTKIMLRAARSAAHFHGGTGQLRKSLGRKVAISRRTPGKVTGWVGPRLGFREMLIRKGKKAGPIDPVKYAHLVEQGTKAHAIGKGSSLRKGRTAGGMHPGAKAQPFLRPAFDQASSAIQGAMAAAITSGITTAAKGGTA